jgi:two-component system, cell cycle sensor histidine kinase and response regulator CckA
VHINVTDTGEGIPAEDVPYLFEPLFTTKSTGNGLGLSVVYQVVTGHGGHIFVETRRDYGTTFHVFIPRALGSEPRTRDEQQRSRPRLGRLRVLIAEDDLSVATGLKWILEAEGISVHVVSAGTDVLPAIAKFKPEVLLLDRSLCAGDANDLYERAVARIPVILSTGSTGAPDANQSRHASVAVLTKPFTADDLLRAIHAVLTNPAST